LDNGGYGKKLKESEEKEDVPAEKKSKESSEIKTMLTHLTAKVDGIEKQLHHVHKAVTNLHGQKGSVKRLLKHSVVDKESGMLITPLSPTIKKDAIIKGEKAALNEIEKQEDNVEEDLDEKKIAKEANKNLDDVAEVKKDTDAITKDEAMISNLKNEKVKVEATLETEDAGSATDTKDEPETATASSTDGATGSSTGATGSSTGAATGAATGENSSESRIETTGGGDDIEISGDADDVKVKVVKVPAKTVVVQPPNVVDTSGKREPKGPIVTGHSHSNNSGAKQPSGPYDAAINEVEEEGSKNQLKTEEEKKKEEEPMKPDEKCILIENIPGCPAKFVGSVHGKYTLKEIRNAVNTFYPLYGMVKGFISPKKMPKDFDMDKAFDLLKKEVCNTYLPKCTMACTRQQPCRKSILSIHSKYLKGTLDPNLVTKIMPGGEYESYIKMFVPDTKTVGFIQDMLKNLSNPKSEVYSDADMCSSRDMAARTEKC
jgi:hypothetical protein